jgi:hypothetical protein
MWDPFHLYATVSKPVGLRHRRNSGGKCGLPSGWMLSWESMDPCLRDEIELGFPPCEEPELRVAYLTACYLARMELDS